MEICIGDKNFRYFCAFFIMHLLLVAVMIFGTSFGLATAVIDAGNVKSGGVDSVGGGE